MFLDDAEEAVASGIDLEVGVAEPGRLRRQGNGRARNIRHEAVDASIGRIGEVHGPRVSAHRPAAVLVHPGARGMGSLEQVGDHPVVLANDDAASVLNRTALDPVGIAIAQLDVLQPHLAGGSLLSRDR